MAEQHIFEVELPNGEIIEVEAPENTPEAQIKARVQQFRNKRAGIKSVSPLEGMSRTDRVVAGIGRSADTTVKGVKQLGTSLASYFVDSNPLLFSKETGQGLRDSMARQKADEADRRKLDAPLMGDRYGMGGNIAGTVGQIVAPGGIAKLISKVPALAAAPSVGRLAGLVGRASLPSSVGGAAAQGAVIGAAQPMVEGENRLSSMAFNAAGGALGAKVGQVVGGIVRGGVRGVDREVAETLLREASDPNNLTIAQPSRVQGVVRSLAEETRDEGIARLERTLRDKTGGWRSQDLANNAARVNAIRQFAGDDQALRNAIAARTAAAAPPLEAAKQVTGVDTAGLLQQVDDLIQQYTGNSQMQGALRRARGEIEASGGNMAYLENARQAIGRLISGTGDDSGVKLPDLIRAKDALTGTMRGASADFGNYLDTFKGMSLPINRMQIGQELIGPRAGSAVLDELGNQTLLPASFSRMSRDLDGVAQRATGFNRASASTSLQPDDFATIAAVQDDLERQAFRQTAGSGGNSQMAQRQELARRLVNRTAANAGARAIPLIGGNIGAALDYLEKMGAARLNNRLAEVARNPEQARAILSRMAPPERRLLEQAISRIGASGGVPAAAAAGAPGALEFDVAGGTPISDDEFEAEFGFRPR